jgi:hypothetical protein
MATHIEQRLYCVVDNVNGCVYGAGCVRGGVVGIVGTGNVDDDCIMVLRLNV